MRTAAIDHGSTSGHRISCARAALRRLARIHHFLREPSARINYAQFVKGSLRWSEPDANSRSLWRGKLLSAEAKGPEVDQHGLEKANPFSPPDQWFESISLQQTVHVSLKPSRCRSRTAGFLWGRAPHAIMICRQSGGLVLLLWRIFGPVGT